MATAKAATKTDIAVAATNAVVAADAYAEYAGSGFENQDSSDYAIPFLGILQAISPELKEHKDWRQGQIFNTVTGEIFTEEDGIAFVPAYTEHCYMEWKPRDQGGGLVARHELADEIVADAKKRAGTDFGKLQTADKNDLIETYYVYGSFLDNDGVPQQAVIAFTSTKISTYKAWMTKAKTIQMQRADGSRFSAPLFAHRYRLKAITQKNNKGEFWNWSINFDGKNALECRIAPDTDLFQSAVALKKLMEDGRGKADLGSLRSSGVGEEDGNGAGGGAGPTPGQKAVF